jgi:hypothetical protein
MFYVSWAALVVGVLTMAIVLWAGVSAMLASNQALAAQIST